MTESMIERVAEVIEEKFHEHAWPEGSYAIAQAVIEAMREPTVRMIDAACAAQIDLYPAWEGQKPQPTAGEVVSACHRAMIDAALKWPAGSADRSGVPMADD